MMKEPQLERIPNPLSPDAADHADRLRLIACDLRVLDMALSATPGRDIAEDERGSLLMHIRRMIADVEELGGDVIDRDRKGRE